MTNLKAVIVDEERLARISLRRLLEHISEIEITGEANSCESALELINRDKPQVIFLDLQLHGETGFDLLELIDNAINIIFVTAYDENAFRAFKVNAFDYLSKPVNPDRLREAIEKVKSRESTPKSEARLFEYSGNFA